MLKKRFVATIDHMIVDQNGPDAMLPKGTIVELTDRVGSLFELSTNYPIWKNGKQRFYVKNLDGFEEKREA